MAEHIVSSVASAVTSEVAKTLVSWIIGKLDRHGAAAAEKKLRRLDLLLVQIHSAVEASEKHSIENASLIRWRDKLKQAAAEGDEVLASFRPREVDPSAPAAAAAEATGDEDAQQQQEHPSSSSSSASATATTAATSRNAPLGIMAQKNILRSAAASDEDMVERLNRAVERLEELSPEIKTFVKLLKFEVLKPEQTSSAGNRRKSDEVLTPDQQTSTGNRKKMTIRHVMYSSLGAAALRERAIRSSRWPFAVPIDAVLVEAGMTGALPAHRRLKLFDRLFEAFVTIYRSVELANDCNMTGHVWLAYWASILKEAKDQVSAVLSAINEAQRNTSEEAEVEVVGCDDYPEEDSALGRFMCSMESLAGEADCFSDLACLCPPPSYY